MTVKRKGYYVNGGGVEYYHVTLWRARVRKLNLQNCGIPSDGIFDQDGEKVN